MKKNIFLKMNVIFLLLLPIPPVYADFSCPPSEAIHCSNGTCQLDPTFQDKWQIQYVFFHPKQVQFLGIIISKHSNDSSCSYIDELPNEVRLSPKKNIQPDTKAPGNDWYQGYSGDWICGYGLSHPTINQCPILD